MSIYLDGFKIRLSESTSILRPEDAITIRYQCKQEEKEKSKPKAQPTKETMPNPIQQEPTPVVIDNSKNQSEEAGIAIPTNRIIRFDGDEESPRTSETPLRIREPTVPTHTNTNTPTVNAREKKKKTRRGKRAGKHSASQEVKPIAVESDSVLSSKPEVSFLDFIVHEPPSVMANSAIHSFVEPVTGNSATHSFVEPVTGNSATHSFVEPQEPQTPSNQPREEPKSAATAEKYSPMIQDLIQFNYVVLNRETFSPEVKQVRGRVLT